MNFVAAVLYDNIMIKAFKRNSSKALSSRSKNEWESNLLSADMPEDIEMQQTASTTMSIGYYKLNMKLISVVPKLIKLSLSMYGRAWIRWIY